MKKFVIFALMFFVIMSCKQVTDGGPDDKFYRDFDLIIVSINNQTQMSEGETSKPELCNIILFETTAGFEYKNNTVHLYREINTCNDRIYTDDSKCGCTEGFHIDTKWIYNHRPGDVVHFDYMLKSKFFEITKR